MTLTVAQLRSAFAFYSRRHGLGVELNETAALAAVTLLDSIDPPAADYPAAVFYAFGRHPRSFPRATRAFTGRATYGDVQRWFAENTR